MKHLTPLRAIRAKCLECAGRRKVVRNCEEADCPLFAFRFGKNPHRKGIGRPGGNYTQNCELRLRFLTKKGIVEGDGSRI